MITSNQLNISSNKFFSTGASIYTVSNLVVDKDICDTNAIWTDIPCNQMCRQTDRQRLNQNISDGNLRISKRRGWRPPKLTATIGVEHVKSLGINHKGQGKNDTRTFLHKSTLCISLS